MTDDELKTMKKEVAGKKRIAMDFASQVHDLVEDRLLTDYKELVALAERTVAACEEWAVADSEYRSVT
ncbi:CCE_0567 family metalloprotein [Pseudomaricurvus sp. HS19]|uniref:CCE_0567 family metalloprotein n=1 Tax=Pseudomaricurvus sp. HS19 TaxID=2692626 RepID=UPI00136F8CEB|nr:CCE_0567 family metalloprotein [Pseudomaricurvus sp. HS19]MYM62484.1 hypothetical protein [Pseudomaricurvus sp. HS19]